ncbi:DUF7933 domain-containing protein [Lysobacter sp. CA196]|uniref:DUF7933 domain-containing protein n=1 Tax=Lysobacter sp. CA196 TaxID=3455606 RepID=UPI003F8D3BBF
MSYTTSKVAVPHLHWRYKRLFSGIWSRVTGFTVTRAVVPEYDQSRNRPRALCSLSLLIALLFACTAAPAQTTTTTKRYQQNIVGGASMFGNSWFYSIGAAPPVLVPDVDNATILGPQSTHSTYADLILPPGSTIVKAYLYTEMSMYNGAPEPVMNSVKFAAPGDASYTTLTSASAGFVTANTANQPAIGDYRQMAWDITGRINPNAYNTSASGGTAGRFFLADPSPLPFSGPFDLDRMGGWSIIVVYTNPNSPARSITVSDAWVAYITGGLITDILGIQVPSSGPVKAVVGLTGSYGDRGSSDSLRFGLASAAGTALADPSTGSTTDVMNSSVAWAPMNNVAADGGPALSGNQTTRSPISAYTGLYQPAESWQYDSDIFNVGGILPNSSTPINVRLSSSTTEYLANGAYFISIDIALPKLTKALAPVSINAGGIATYTWTIDNTVTGSVGMTGIGFIDALPSSIVVATPNAATTTCSGGSVVATPGSAQVSLSGASVGAGQTCTVTVAITNVAGQTNADCASNPSAFTNSAANIASSSNVVNALTPVCLVVLPSSTITIVKDALPDDAQDFVFNTTGDGLSGFTLDDDGDATLSNTRTFTGLTAGSYTVTESAVPGWSLSELSCTDPDSGTTANLGTGTAAIDLDTGEHITCTYTNTRRIADLSITKTNTPGLNGEVDQTNDTLAPGSSTAYTIVVKNAGPDRADGAVIRDQATAGLGCVTATCTASGGAVCPAAVDVAGLQGSGLVIPTFPADASLTFLLTCTVQ